MAGEGSGGGAGTTNSGAGDWSSAMMAGAGCFGAATAAGGLGMGSAAAILAGGAASAMAGAGTTVVGAGGGGSGWLKLTTAGEVATAGSTAGSTDGGGVGSGGEGIVGAALANGWESGGISRSMLCSGGGAELAGRLLAAGAGASATSRFGARTRRTCQGKARPGSPNSSPVRVTLNRRAWMAIDSSNAKRSRRAGGRGRRTACRPGPGGPETGAAGGPDGRFAALPDSARLKCAPPWRFG